jgi:hypothetical protein
MYVRKCMKEPLRAKALIRDEMEMKITRWADGARKETCKLPPPPAPPLLSPLVSPCAFLPHPRLLCRLTPQVVPKFQEVGKSA